MSLGWNPIYLQTNRELLQYRFNQLSASAAKWSSDALNLAEQMADVDLGAPVDPLAGVAALDLQLEELGDLPAVTAGPPAYAARGTAPVAPVPQLGSLQVGTAKFSGKPPQPPTPQYPAAPSPSAGEFSGERPQLGELPPAPQFAGIALPDEPELNEIALPSAPSIDLDKFVADRPTIIDPTHILDGFDYRGIAESTQVAMRESVDDPAGDHATGTISRMLEGETGLPIIVEQALFDRAVVRNEKSSAQAIDQATAEWARRGFSMPGSTLLQQIAMVRQANRDSRCVTGREILVQVHKEALESIRHAVSEGIRAQGNVFQLYSQIFNASMEMANGMFTVLRAVVDARIEMFKAEVDAYEAEVRVFAEKIRAELGRIEIYKGQLEGARIQGELNEQAVRTYIARVQAAETLVGVFRAEVEAYRATVESRNAVLEQYRTEVQAYGALVEADKVKADIYGTQMRAEGTKIDAYEAEVRAFAGLVSAYSAEVQAETATVDAQVKIQQSKVDTYRGQVEGWRTGEQIAIEEAKLTLDYFAREIDNVRLAVESQTKRGELQARMASLKVEEKKANDVIAIASAEQYINQLQALVRTTVAKLDAAARTTSQLAASAMSAVNISASVSDGSSTSSSQSSSYSETLER